MGPFDVYARREKPKPPERIFGWLDTQLSIARHYGAMGARTKREVAALAAESNNRMWLGARKGARVSPHVSLMPGEFRT